MTIKIALIGDRSDEQIAHRAIPEALKLTAEKNNIDHQTDWINSTEIALEDLEGYQGIWCVPASPYKDAEKVIASIRYARESGTAFIGTCGGYQHAVIEYAQNVLGHQNATSTEDNPETDTPLINAMFCAMREKPGQIKLTKSSRIYSIYQQHFIEEQYNCGFGINTELLHIFDNSDLKFTGHSADEESLNDPRALEHVNHPFFIATAYQPERSALNEQVHPLIESFLIEASKTL